MLIATLFASLPLTVFALLALMGRARGSGWRESILQAATAWGALVVVVTEGLSSVTFLNRISLACAWGLLAFLVLVVYRYLWTTLVPGDRNGSVFKDAESAFTSQLAIGAIMVIWGLVGLTAIFAPPNTWDAMQYHMPRIVHWLHNQSVAFYPANEIRQLNMPPWAEYAILQFHAATGGDWLDNLVQWFSMGLSALTVSLIVRELGVGKNGQALAAFLCATLPEGILEASAAKNDYVVAFWISATVYFLLTFGRKPSVKTALPLGLAAGLAILTKGTAEIFLAAFAMILVTWDRKTIGQAVRFAPIIVILGLGLNAPHFKRNLELFGSPLGPAAYSPSGQFKLSNDGFTPPIIISNILRNLALQIESPSAVLNSKIEASVGAILKLMGEDLNDPRATWDYTNFHVAEMPRHEGYAGNPLHLGLFLVASAILAFRWLRNRTDFRLLIFAAAVAMGFFLFCVYLKWQPWHTRLLIPAFVVASAISGAVLATTLPTMLQGALLVALPIFAGPALLENIIRPLTYAGDLNVFNQNRTNQMFAELPSIRRPYELAARFVNAQTCSDIGIDTRPEGGTAVFEYPLLVLLGDRDGSRNIREIEITSVAKRYETSDKTKPCIVICPICATAPNRAAIFQAQGMTLTAFGEVAVFTRGAIIQLPPATSLSAPAAGIAPTPSRPSFAQPGDDVVFGDWSGDGRIKIGVFRKGVWILNVSEDSAAPTGKTMLGQFGLAGDIPVVGDWDGKGKTKVGVFRNGVWILDLSGSARFNKDTVRQIQLGLPGDVPVVGDWNGDGSTKVGVFRKGLWILDYGGFRGNQDELREGGFGQPGDIPVVGDWDGKHKDKVGVFRAGVWSLDLSGTAKWNPSSVIQGSFGLPGDTPIVGDWDGSGRSKIGIIRDGCWQVDLSGTATWNPSTSAMGCSEVPGPGPRRR